MADLGPPDLDRELPGNPLTLVNFRTGTSQSIRLTIRHVLKALEGECPICEGRLSPEVITLFPLRPPEEGGPESRSVGRCDRCWLDYIPRMTQDETGRDWRLDIIEREASPSPKSESGHSLWLGDRG